MTMDEELRRALRRVEPPAGFADRVLLNVSGSRRPEPASPKRPEVAKAGWAIAATLAIAIGSGAWYRAEERRRERHEGEEAKRQVLLSLSIAGTKLRSVQLQINHGEER